MPQIILSEMSGSTNSLMSKHLEALKVAGVVYIDYLHLSMAAVVTIGSENSLMDRHMEALKVAGVAYIYYLHSMAAMVMVLVFRSMVHRLDMCLQ